MPRSRAYLRLLSIRQDPAAYFLPFADPSNKDKSSIFAGPAGLAPELTELFTFDVNSLRRRRTPEADAEEEPAAKRIRQEDEGEEDEELASEIGRRAEDESARRESLGLGLDLEDDTGDVTLRGAEGEGSDMPPLDEGMPDLDLGLEGEMPAAEEEAEQASGTRRSSRRAKAAATTEEEDDLPGLTRLSTPDEGESEIAVSLSATSSNPLAAFDQRPTQGQESAEQVAAAESADNQEAASQGWSKNTVRAMRVVRSQLSAPGATREVADTQTELSYEGLSQNASRRAAAGFFFELLVLGTKDCVKLRQPEAYGDIKVRGKEKLWKNAPAAAEGTGAEASSVGAPGTAIVEQEA